MTAGNSEGKKTTTLEKKKRRGLHTAVTIKQHSPTSGLPGAEAEVRTGKTGNLGELIFLSETF